MTELETEYLEALERSEEIGAQLVAYSSTSSRETSLSYTKLQESRMWFGKHISERANREMERARHDGS